MFRLVFVALLALPTLAPAQDVTFSPDHSSACLRDGGGTECIGVSATRCMDDSAAGYSTVGMNACLGRELEWWDAELNRAYRALYESEQALDKEEAEYSPDRPSGADALQQAQRAWIAFRDATCVYEELLWYGGTGASGAHISCVMRLTGQQTLYLADMLGSE